MLFQVLNKLLEVQTLPWQIVPSLSGCKGEEGFKVPCVTITLTS